MSGAGGAGEAEGDGSDDASRPSTRSRAWNVHEAAAWTAARVYSNSGGVEKGMPRLIAAREQYPYQLDMLLDDMGDQFPWQTSYNVTLQESKSTRISLPVSGTEGGVGGKRAVRKKATIPAEKKYNNTVKEAKKLSAFLHEWQR